MIAGSFSEYIEDQDIIRESVRSVLNKKSLGVVYQPIVDHAQNRILGYEALTRPVFNGHVIRPDLWFQAAHDINCSVEADLLALTSILEDAALLPQEDVSRPLFVNVMPTSLCEPAYLEELAYLFRQGFCKAGQLVLEIVEYVDYPSHETRAITDILDSLGVRIALDDYGVKEASREILCQLSPHFVKIDRSLIHGLSIHPSKRTRLMELIGEIKCSPHNLIVEGVETPGDLLAVTDVGISLSQGYYWGRPMEGKQLPGLALQIETARAGLNDLVERKRGRFTDPEVVRKSHELDSLIVQHYKSKGFKERE